MYRQRQEGQGKSRHYDKKATPGKPIYNKIYSDLSLKTHLSRIEQFSGWVKENHSDIKNLREITPHVVGDYLKQQVENGKSAYTLSADMLAINRVMIGSSNWESPLQKSDYNLPKRSFDSLRNNHVTKHRTLEQREHDDKLRERYSDVLTYGQAFGLRRSELVPSASRQTVAGTKSLYEHRGRLYHATTGKGGRLRVVECLRSHEQSIRELYGQHIQQMPVYLTKDSFTKEDIQQFREEHKPGKRHFDSLSKSLRIHVECRQYYAKQKLEEIQQDRDEERSVVINGVSLSRDEANEISKNLGHGKDRWDVLSRYLGR